MSLCIFKKYSKCLSYRITIQKLFIFEKFIKKEDIYIQYAKSYLINKIKSNKKILSNENYENV